MTFVCVNWPEQNMEYKFVELLSCRFFASPEDMVRAQVGGALHHAGTAMPVGAHHLTHFRVAIHADIGSKRHCVVLLQPSRCKPDYAGSCDNGTTHEQFTGNNLCSDAPLVSLSLAMHHFRGVS